MRPQAHIQAQLKDRVLQRHTTLRDVEPLKGEVMSSVETIWHQHQHQPDGLRTAANQGL
jgi:hypothetical protein